MRGSIRQRSKGSWELRYDGPRKTGGRRRYVSETVRGTKRDAERVLRDRLAALEAGAHVPKTRETVAEFMSTWMQNYAATNTLPSTRYGYQGYINRYIVPTIGHISIQKLTAADIQALYGELAQLGKSPTTIVQLHRIIHKALAEGVRWGILTRNVADATTPPRLQKQELRVWDMRTTVEFLQAIRGTRYGNLYSLAALTGMRRSELCGLKWEDVDLVNKRLRVLRSLQRIPGTGIQQGPTKTQGSRRSIRLSDAAVTVLHGIRGRQLTQEIEAGDDWQDTGLVFTGDIGQPLSPDVVSRQFSRLVKKAGLPHLTLHGLRHGLASLLLSANINPKVVSELLGHSNIGITMDTYSHVLPDIQDTAARAVDDAFFLPTEMPTESPEQAMAPNQFWDGSSAPS